MSDDIIQPSETPVKKPTFWEQHPKLVASIEVEKRVRKWKHQKYQAKKKVAKKINRDLWAVWRAGGSEVPFYDKATKKYKPKGGGEARPMEGVLSEALRNVARLRSTPNPTQMERAILEAYDRVLDAVFGRTRMGKAQEIAYGLWLCGTWEKARKARTLDHEGRHQEILDRGLLLPKPLSWAQLGEAIGTVEYRAVLKAAAKERIHRGAKVLFPWAEPGWIPELIHGLPALVRAAVEDRAEKAL
jgi:hypothetical protein